ncbi:transcription elongation factor subunit Spt4 [Sulfurisphaera ohwakuensis]|uniref:Transcription elongation factor Spt4 n=1 Tax=Sulfurisphaera ohwakuensis TaxID=69656 RepID=A0A650CE54_SULOH|nr:transcription elongation factor subunit Spt4 [Sulfurisphaera ohwakuensis]MBB5253051.1 DNA-directed RNA polymerase subunit E' [Sulfurisphaera ohwakuensis]QGR16026.1 DNA-binding protein [Sulfurisphaera ohwakuensis]
MPGKNKEFKACKNCRALVTQDTPKCPVCGSISFSDDWSGIVIILDPQSETAKLFGATVPWRYAVIVK